MKKYIKPAIECYEIGATNLCASSPSADLTFKDDYNGSWDGDIDVLSKDREESGEGGWGQLW